MVNTHYIPAAKRLSDFANKMRREARSQCTSHPGGRASSWVDHGETGGTGGGGQMRKSGSYSVCLFKVECSIQEMCRFHTYNSEFWEMHTRVPRSRPEASPGLQNIPWHPSSPSCGNCCPDSITTVGFGSSQFLLHGTPTWSLLPPAFCSWAPS